MTSPEKTPPTAPEVEQLAQEMLELRGKISEISSQADVEIEPLSKKLRELATRAEDWLVKFGSAHAEKSRMLHGVKLEIMGTFGTSTSIDAAAVEVFRQALVQAHQSKLLKKIFRKVIRWELMPNWAETIRGMKLPAKLTALYAACQVTKPRAPTITPREKSAA
jgi:uncharacterized protein YaaN involved in tellurite resistance